MVTKLVTAVLNTASVRMLRHFTDTECSISNQRNKASIAWTEMESHLVTLLVTIKTVFFADGL